jgi:predicted component of type VI protein secretion system
MRTLATTFSNKIEAEAAVRRLEALGLSRERIMLKDVAQAGLSQEGGGVPGGVFVSVKVTTEQVQPVSDILKAGSSGAGSEHAPSAVPPSEPVVEMPAAAPPPVPPAAAPPIAPEPRDTAAAGSAAEAAAKARQGRNMVLFGLALIAAFMIGAWLGLLR